MASVAKRAWTHKGVEKSAWVVRYKDRSGTYRQETFERKKDADARRLLVENEIVTGTHVATRDTVTVAFATDAWLRDCDRRHKAGDDMAGSTLRSYGANAKNHVVPRLGHLKLTEVTHLHLQDFVDGLATTMKPRTVVHIAIIVRSMLKFAVHRGWLGRSPLTDKPLKLPRKRMEQIRIPSRAELARLMDALAQRRPGERRDVYLNRVLIFYLGLFAGLRRGEIAGLLWEDIDLGAGLIRVRHSLSAEDGLKSPKSAAGRRDIPLVGPVVDILTHLQAERGLNGHAPVLQTRSGKAVRPHHVGTSYWKPVLKAADLLKPDGSPMYGLHSLRHAYASLLIASGVEPLKIKKVVGHASIKMTFDTYGHLFPDDEVVRDAMHGVTSQFGLGGDAPPRPPRSAPEEAPKRLAFHAVALSSEACVAGHPLTEANRYVAADGRTNCRECGRLAQARYRQRRQLLAAPVAQDGDIAA